MNKYEARWGAVAHFVNNKLLPNMVGDVQAEYCGMKFNPADVRLDGQYQTFDIVRDNCTFNVYNGDVTHDEGAHDTIKETQERLEQDFKLYQIIPLKERK